MDIEVSFGLANRQTTGAWRGFVLVPGLTDGWDNVEKVDRHLRRSEDGRPRGSLAPAPDGRREVAQARHRVPAGKRRAAGCQVEGQGARATSQPRIDGVLK